MGAKRPKSLVKFKINHSDISVHLTFRESTTGSGSARLKVLRDKG